MAKEENEDQEQDGYMKWKIRKPYRLKIKERQ